MLNGLTQVNLELLNHGIIFSKNLIGHLKLHQRLNLFNIMKFTVIMYGSN